MWWRAPSGDYRALYDAYRRELHQRLMPSYARTAAIVVSVVNAFFIWLDYFAFPSQFTTFLAVRLVLQSVVTLVLIRAERLNPFVSKWALCLATGAMLVTVVYGSGGPTTDYYAGLILLFSGIPVLLPMTGGEAAAACGMFLVSYVASPLFVGGRFEVETFTIHSLFLLSAAIVSGGSARLLDQMRFNDFRRRKEIERARDELRELDKAKSRFTANVHHELRTPLTLLLAPLEALLSNSFGEIPERVRSELATMRANGMRLLKLINDLLELSRLENEARRLHPKRLDLSDCVGRFVAEAEPLARRKELTVTMHGLDAPSVIYADPEAVERVVVNLLGNAVKFTPAGGRIEVSAEESEEGVLLQVADTGIGIPPEQLERVFDRFGQVDTSATRTHEGTGIGLSLAKELVELHGGWIRAESEGIGHGTRMRVWLPKGDPERVEAEDVLLAEPPQSSAAAAGRNAVVEGELGDAALPGQLLEASQAVSRWEDASGRSTEAALPEECGPDDAPELLVVEDNDGMRRLLTNVLSVEYRVRTARNGREALEAVREREPALVLTDIMMPELSGTDLCRHLKDDPSTRGIPVILVTSKAEREMQIEGLELGADDYVVKPFHPRELLARVRSLVRLHQLQMEIAERAEALERALAELKETEVQLVQAERLAAVGELAAGVAHEVNNPLNFSRNSLTTLRSYTEDLAQVAQRVAELDVSDPERLGAQVRELEREKSEVAVDELADDLRELVGIIGQGLDRTARLVGDLRDFAAPDRGQEGRVDLASGLESTLELVGHRLREAGARVETEIAPGLPTVVGDAGALNQVFLNLLKNAAEAIEGNGGGEIAVVARREGSEAVVRVRDDGPGMDSGVQARLFEPFFTTKSAGRGTGLGLSICRRIVEQHGGRIEVESSPGRGTSVIVRLPAGEAHAA